MKILLLAPYSPVPPVYGGALRIYHVLKELAKNNEVTFLFFGTGRDLIKIEKYFGDLIKEIHLVKPTWACNYRRLAQLYALFSRNSFFSLFSKSKAMQSKIDELLSENNYDIIQCEFPIMGCYEFKTDTPRILDEHNIEYDNFRRIWKKTGSPLHKLHYYFEYKKTKREELKVIGSMQAVFTVSERDKNILEQQVPGIPKSILPNGVEGSYFKAGEGETESYTMVFTGMMGYVPNYDGIIYFLDNIFPLILKEIPNAKIYIVGNNPPRVLQSRATSNIIVTGFVDDVRPFIRRSELYVVPLRMGGGTRLKVLEALSMKKVVISTSIGCEGIAVTDKKNVLIADDPVEFANRAVNVLKNPGKYNEIRLNGYDLVRSKYDWGSIVSTMEEQYKKVKNESQVVNEINEGITEVLENVAG